MTKVHRDDKTNDDEGEGRIREALGRFVLPSKSGRREERMYGMDLEALQSWATSDRPTSGRNSGRRSEGDYSAQDGVMV